MWCFSYIFDFKSAIQGSPEIRYILPLNGFKSLIAMISNDDLHPKIALQKGVKY